MHLYSFHHFIVWKILDLIIGLRVDEETEVNGLDIHETGLEAYQSLKEHN